MPQYAGVRKASLMSTSNGERRTTSGRAIRANTTRPSNYYARPFGNAPDEQEEMQQIGFFPAVTFFTDAITALPREVIKQFTLMKEVEAKIHGPAEHVGAMCDDLMKIPAPPRREGQSALIMSFTAPNSNAGSTNASLINGVAPRYGQDSAAGSVIGDEETEETLSRRKKYAELRSVVHSMLPNLDEKNVVLTEAIRVMNAQLSRIDSVMPHVETEIPEEARLGSMTHWAYSDNRVKTKAAQASRRDVVSTNNLAAAAHAIHETEIAQTRRDAVKEARGEKVKGKQREDSEFEEKPRKLTKPVKAKVGLGISNGEVIKRRKLEKPPVMERQVSNMGRKTPRSTPAEEPKKVKPKPIPKRRGISAQASPALASSPIAMEPPRPQSARLRQNSSASNLRHERNVDEAPRKRTREEEDYEAVETTEPGSPKIEERPLPSRSNSSNKTPSGGPSKVGTPRPEQLSDASMARQRSTRSGRSKDESQPAEGSVQKGHKRNGGVGSVSGLMKQIAPFNRSPDLDRHRSRDNSDDSEQRSEHSRPASRHSTPPRQESPPQLEVLDDTIDDEMPDVEEPPALTPDVVEIEPNTPSPSPSLSPVGVSYEEPVEEPVEDMGEDDIEEVEEEGDDPDPDDPSEPKYCYCMRGSYGDMVGCDNNACPREWFHLGCTGLKKMPTEEESWYCDYCKPAITSNRRRGNGRGRGR